MAKLNQESPNNSSPKNFSKVSKDAIPKKEVGSSLTKTLPEPVCKHIVFSDSELNPSDTMPATSIKTVHLPKHRTGVNTLPNGMSRNYISSVSYTLRNLLNESSSESESSSTDSAHEYTTQNPVPMNNSSRQITKQLTSADVPTENSIGSNLVADSDINNWNEMFDEMQRLGFPTTFGRVCSIYLLSIN
ncbi:unnamed protein product [Trichobilharzia regenti]|nr:unnamed protein product [Trichobilharzia regenti]